MQPPSNSQFPQDSNFGAPATSVGFDDNFAEGQEFTVFTPRQKEPYWRRIGGGSLGLSILIHVGFLLIAYFLIKFALPEKKKWWISFLVAVAVANQILPKSLARRRLSRCPSRNLGLLRM
jgi:hypothetical protein